MQVCYFTLLMSKGLPECFISLKKKNVSSNVGSKLKARWDLGLPWHKTTSGASPMAGSRGLSFSALLSPSQMVYWGAQQSFRLCHIAALPLKRDFLERDHVLVQSTNLGTLITELYSLFWLLLEQSEDKTPLFLDTWLRSWAIWSLILNANTDQLLESKAEWKIWKQNQAI